jgi:hypothetical protein
MPLSTTAQPLVLSSLNGLLAYLEGMSEQRYDDRVRRSTSKQMVGLNSTVTASSGDARRKGGQRRAAQYVPNIDEGLRKLTVIKVVLSQ